MKHTSASTWHHLLYKYLSFSARFLPLCSLFFSLFFLLPLLPITACDSVEKGHLLSYDFFPPVSNPAAGAIVFLRDVENYADISKFTYFSAYDKPIIELREREYLT